MRTPNLLLRPYASTDAEALFGFMGNAAAMQHTYVAPSLYECHARLQAYEDMRIALGFAPWVASAQDNGNVIGWGGLCLDPQEPEWGLEVIYAFAPEAWGNGFATELVRFSLEHARTELAAPEVHAFAKTANVQSVRVLVKCGFQYSCFEPQLDRDHYMYRFEGPA